jgi:NitT/TauT family transport system permease protein
MKSSVLSRSARWAGPVIVLALLVGVWYLVAHWEDSRDLGYLVPYPHDVWSSGFADSQTRSDLLSALWQTSQVTLIGLMIAIVIGVVWAMAMAQAKWAEQSLYPYAVVLQCIPILALVPLIGAMFGYEFRSRIIVTVIIAIFPMVSNTLFGLQSTERGQRELFALHQASRFTMLQKLQFKAALPSMFVGLRTSAGMAVIGAIVADQFFQRGKGGLGVLIQVSASRLEGPTMWAAMLTAAFLGIAVFLLFGLPGRLAVGRWHDFS